MEFCKLSQHHFSMERNPQYVRNNFKELFSHYVPSDQISEINKIRRIFCRYFLDTHVLMMRTSEHLKHLTFYDIYATL